jgi:hypothetical protein
MTREITIYPVSGPALGGIFRHVQEYFESFAARSKATTVEGLWQDVVTSKRQMWLAFEGDDIKACALSKFEKGEAGSTVEMTHCSGEEREKWAEQLVNMVRDWAKAEGATSFRTYSRPGWTPFLKKMGMRETHRVMEQDIG